MSETHPAYALADETVRLMKDRGFPAPAVGIVLGSGLGPLATRVTDPVTLPTSEIPGYPASTVAGHKGEYIGGTLAGVPVVMANGRIHGYEGYEESMLGLPARILARAGARTIVVTNAAGGIRYDFQAGDLMLIRDHINLSGRTPLTGPNDDSFGERFPDMTTVYPVKLRDLAREHASRLGLTLHEGVYAGVAGPQYETPAEVKMLGILGGDAVGMSTVPESIAAAHMKVPVLGLSVIANRAAGLHATPLTHDEVLEAVESAASKASRLVESLVPDLAGG